MGYAATLGAAGTVMFLAYTDAWRDAVDDTRLRRWLLLSLAAAVVAGGARLMATAASMSDSAAGLIDVRLLRLVLQSGEAWSGGARLLGVLLMAGSATARLRSAPVRAAALAGAVLAATSFAWQGHVHALPRPDLGTLLLCVHLLCVAFWIGALVPLLVLARRASPQRLGAAAGRFGRLALAVVGVLLVAGGALLALLLTHVDELWTSDYGRLVSGKLLLVTGLLALAAGNRLWLTPRLSRGDAAARRTLRAAIAAETALVCGILLITAAMTTVTGPAALS